ncbi:non-ribosomal peptide synthetase/MFS transporter [Catelliglobosispora koreensis]|uniref:non-ribosomal peptide synthetase/MFS transporter n=1 Tax=Catelliglobosispora koreensis TaxID=129052 RepID=UPI000382173A|nr:non-ribosomal peptide synthetase/MFS transporter [Catelliglobosispora koreensis]
MTSNPVTADREAARKALIAQRLRRRAPETVLPTIAPRPEGAVTPLSWAQERVWFMDQVAPGELAYHIAVPVRVAGPVDTTALRAALDQLALRHESLRTRFPADADGQPTAVVETTVSPPLRFATAPDRQAAQQLVETTVAEPFDLANGPLLRALLITIAGDDHVLLLTMHHIISDGWSVDVMLRDLITCYRGGDLPELPIQYGDFAYHEAQDTAGLPQHLEYWKQRLSGVAPLELPLDHPRPATQTYKGDFVELTLDARTTGRLEALSRAEGSTLFMTLLAAWQVFLSRHSGQDDFAVGVSVAGRSAPELENVIGMFINMLPMRAEVSGDPAFKDLLSRTKASVLDAFEHADVPFAKVVQELRVARDVSRSPVFQSMFVLQNYEMGRFASVAGQDETTFTWMPMELKATRFDLELHLVEVGDGLWGKLVYNTDLFTRSTVEQMTGRLTALLRSIAADPQAAVSALDIMDVAERALVTQEWNDTALPFPNAVTLHEQFEAQASRTPDAVAVTFEGASVTYAELDALANRIAYRLRQNGVGPETLVGVFAERSVELVAALLGILKAGGAYVPLDPEYPADRIAFMVEDAAASVVLTLRRLRDLLPAVDVPVLDLDDAAQWEQGPVPGSLSGPGNLAYVIYTSGSTGRPKGVPNTHRAVVNRLDWMQRTYQIGVSDAVLQKTPASFDVSVWEFFWPLQTGARLVLARPGGHKDAGYLQELIDSEKITTAHFVPSMLAVFLSEFDGHSATSLRRVICSGEELPMAVALDFTARLPWCGLHNLYGPTEAAIDVTSWECAPSALAGLTSVPIGQPISNLRTYVLDAQLRPVPVGVSGELCIGGVGLARGYLGRPGLTAERFVPDPFTPGARLYRTGDLVRWRGAENGGVIEFLGRIDHQVKLRGLRIELGEIESALRDQDGVSDAVVLVREDTPGDKRLVAYIVGAATATELKAALKTRLPDYMVPATFVTLDALPLGPNGKLDRKALPAPVATRDSDTAMAEPTTPTEVFLAELWTQVLGLPAVGIDDDFFDLGGHSMLGTQVIARIRKAGRPGRQVGVMDLFQARTIRELGALIDGEGDTGPRNLLYDLNPQVQNRTLTYICVPYGGGSAIVYQPLAEALPSGHGLYALAIPGHDVGLDEAALPFDELTSRVATEVLERVTGPIALYGHCGVGSAIVAEVARKLEGAGRELEAVYIGAMFPFARPKGPFSRLRTKLEKLRSNRHYASWLKSMGVDTDELDPEQADRIISNMRADSRASEEYFTRLLDERVDKLRAPIISVVGSEDPVTDYFTERYAEWQFLSETLGLVVLDRAGHFFLKYRANELAEIVTSAHRAIDTGDTEPLTPAVRGADAAWTLRDWKTPQQLGSGPKVKPSMGRFLSITLGQFIATTGAALTAFALPIWLYTQTGSVTNLGLLWAIALLCGVITLPVAGALTDRADRRRIMMIASSVSGSLQLVLFALLWTESLTLWQIYVLVALTQVSASFQRIAFQTAMPQLVPKRYLGHAMGIAQLTNGFAMLFMPLAAAALLAAISLHGIVLITISGYILAVCTLAIVRFPDLLGFRPREPLLTAIANGMRFSWNHRGFRLMIGYFAIGNIFLAPALVLFTPLVLAFGNVTDVAQVAVAEALGMAAGGILMSIWGGPRKRRMIGVLIANFGTAIGCAAIGLHAGVSAIAAAAFFMAMSMSVAQGIYITIVQVKVPQRYHGRVFAINQTMAWSTLPIGFALLAPASTALFEPWFAPGGLLASSVGQIIGTGPGRGIGFAYIVFGVALMVITVVGFMIRMLRRFDLDVPDSLPDDLIGAQEREERLAKV